jgi:hypothetical protein
VPKNPRRRKCSTALKMRGLSFLLIISVVLLVSLSAVDAVVCLISDYPLCHFSLENSTHYTGCHLHHPFYHSFIPAIYSHIKIISSIIPRVSFTHPNPSHPHRLISGIHTLTHSTSNPDSLSFSRTILWCAFLIVREIRIGRDFVTLPQPPHKFATSLSMIVMISRPHSHNLHYFPVVINMRRRVPRLPIKSTSMSPLGASPQVAS